MTTYHTNNPIGSTDPRDLYDNAENLDKALNSRSEIYWDDRFGVWRKTYYGFERQFEDFLASSGYQEIGDYGPGLQITARNQIFWKDGEIYRAGPDVVLPYTTTGDWASESSLFVSVGDAYLRQSLAGDGGSAMIGHSEVAGGPTTTVKEVLLSDSARVDLFRLPSDHDDTPAMIRALAAAKWAIIDEDYGPFVFSGTVSIPSNRVILTKGCPKINFTLTSNGYDQGDRGFWFPPGTEGSAWIGNADIESTCLVSAVDGSIGNLFTFGQYFYGSGVDAEKCFNHSIIGNIKANGTIVGNLKTIGIYGWCERIWIKGVCPSGQNTFGIAAHWGQNITLDERMTEPLSTLPSKTWHPHNIVFDDCNVDINWPNSRAFTLSAPGRVEFNRCGSNTAASTFWLFCGDFGYTYCQNLGDKPFPQIELNDVYSNGATNFPLSADFISSPSGAFAEAKLWASADRKNGGYIKVSGMKFSVPNGVISGVTFTGLDKVIMDEVYGHDTGPANTNRMVNIMGCNDVDISRSCEFVTNAGHLVRNSGRVYFGGSTYARAERPNDATYGISVSALSFDTTVLDDYVAGSSSITLASQGSVVGAGGLLAVIVDGKYYELKMLSSTFGSGERTIEIDSCPVAIPAGHPVTVISSVLSITVDGLVSGFGVNFRATGSATAKVRNVDLSKMVSRRSGAYDAELQNVNGAIVDGMRISDGGHRTTTADKRGVVFSGATENFWASQLLFGNDSHRLRYPVYVAATCSNGWISKSAFLKNSGESNAAAVFIGAGATNINYDTAGCVYGPGVIPKWPV